VISDDPRELRRSDFPVLREVPTRWSDVDIYGHVNNVVHYAMFDTAVNGWLIEQSGTDIRRGDAVGMVAETGCRYLAELDFPGVVTVGLRLDRLGNSSVSYRLALFATANAEADPDTDAGAESPAAVGTFVHVYVDRTTRRPIAVPEVIRTALAVLAP